MATATAIIYTIFEFQNTSCFSEGIQHTTKPNQNHASSELNTVNWTNITFSFKRFTHSCWPVSSTYWQCLRCIFFPYSNFEI